MSPIASAVLPGSPGKRAVKSRYFLASWRNDTSSANKVIADTISRTAVGATGARPPGAKHRPLFLCRRWTASKRRQTVADIATALWDPSPAAIPLRPAEACAVRTTEGMSCDSVPGARCTSKGGERKTITSLNSRPESAATKGAAYRCRQYTRASQARKRSRSSGESAHQARDA
jgi:hypothetical protein